jgi:ribosome biogenesis GTPase A
MHDTEDSAASPLPFTSETSFLGLAGRALFQRLVVVQSSPHKEVKQPWKDMEDAGMRVLSYKSQPDELLRQILVNGKDDQKATIFRKYRDLAQATSRHPDQVVILLVGYSGHGKSKTINRLIGHNLLEVGSKKGSTTKVREYPEYFLFTNFARRLSSG